MVMGMAELIDKWEVVNKLIELENWCQQNKPFDGFRHAHLYQKICQLEIAIGKTEGLRWISVKDEERKPKDRQNYFIAYVFGDSDMHFFGEAKYYAYDGNGIVDRPHFSNEGVDGMKVTHWMEIPKLPQPPKGE